MSRTKQQIPTGNFIFKNKTNAKGKRILYLRYYVNGRAVMTSTGVSVKPEEWDPKKERINPRNYSHESLNTRLKQFKERIDNHVASYTGKLTPGILREMMNGTYRNPDDKEVRNQDDFIDFALSYNQRCYDFGNIAFSTYNNDNYNIELFRQFIAEETGEAVISFNELTLVIFDRYKKYCLDRGNKKSSINKKLKPLFKGLEYAAQCNIITTRQAFNICDKGYYELKNTKYESEVKEDIRYLTAEQLQEFIELYPLMKHDRTREYMDMFLFSFHTFGLRFSDILTLEWRHIDWDARTLTKQLFKEKTLHSISLGDRAIEILERWKSKGYNERFVFNLLPENFNLNNESLLDTKRKSKNRAMQISLQEVGHKLPTKLKFNLSFHVARHSFAVFALNEGMFIHDVSRLMGHTSVTITEKYYAKYLPEINDKELRAKLNLMSRAISLAR